MMDTVIAKAFVTSTFDKDMTATFEADIPDLGLHGVTINYVSPYVPQTNGGMLAMPKNLNVILVCKPSGSEEWYYLGSTFDFADDYGPDSRVDSETVAQKIDKTTTRTTGTPSKIFFTSNLGQGLVISEEYGEAIQNLKTEIKSSTRKRISLIDTPALDQIVLDSGNSSKITITDTPLGGLFAPPAQAILLDSNGPQQLTCQEANIDIAVNDGKDINITNGSTGFNAPPGDPGFGNINLQSDTGDINLFTTKGGGLPTGLNGAPRNTDGRIFLQCLNPQGVSQVIQLETRGTGGNCVIRLISSGKIELTSVQDIDIISGGNINMRAAGNINTQTLAGSTNIISSGNINADAATINLNSGASTPPTPIPTVPPVATSYYPLAGIPTYTNGMFPL